MLEFVTPGQQDWLGNAAPDHGCMITGARYTFTVARVWTDEDAGVIGWEWDLHGTTHPVDGTWFITADADVTLAFSHPVDLTQPMMLRRVALACAQAAFAQLKREAESLRERHLASWPTREAWPEDDYDGYNPAERGFEALRLARERAEWVTGLVRYLREGKEHA